MAVFKINKNKDYTVMSNHHFKDKRLSWKAKGLLSLMLSLPDNWDYSIAGLRTLSSDGETSTRSAIKELEEYGYLTRRKIRENGKIIDWEYNVYEYPVNTKQLLDNPVVENRVVENQAQLNTNISNTKELNTKEYIYSANDKFNPLQFFEKFWSLYPRKVNKKKAQEKFIKICKDEDTYNEIMQGLERYKKSKQWQTIEYIPHAVTWLNGERWKDEIEVKHNEQSGYTVDSNGVKRDMFGNRIAG